MRLESDPELFTSAVYLFPLVDPTQSVVQQRAEYSRHLAFRRDPECSAPPAKEIEQVIIHFFLLKGESFRSHLPGHFRKRSDFRDRSGPLRYCVG